MNVVDSSAWLEYFANGSNASFFARAIERTEELLVPTLVLYEVMNYPTAGYGVSSSVLARHSVLDTESSRALDTGFRRHDELAASRGE